MDNLEKLIDEVKIEYGEQNKKKKRFIFKTVKTEDILKLLESNLPLHLQLEVIRRSYKIKSNVMSYSNFLKKFYPAEYEAFLLRTGTKKKTKKQNVNNDNNVQNNNNDNNNVQNDNNNNVQIELQNNLKTIQHIDNNEFIKKEDTGYVIDFGSYNNKIADLTDYYKAELAKYTQKESSIITKRYITHYTNCLRKYADVLINNNVVKIIFPLYQKLINTEEDKVLLNTKFLDNDVIIGIIDNYIVLYISNLAFTEHTTAEHLSQYHKFKLKLIELAETK
jgi:hypothetical protein